MIRRVSLFALLFFIFSMAAFALTNDYFIQLKLREDMSAGLGVQKTTYESQNDYPMEKLFFRLHFPDDKPQYQIKKITDAKGNNLNFSPSITYPGVIEVLLKSPLKSKEKIALNIEFSVQVSYKPYYIFGYITDCWHPQAIPYDQGKLQPLNKNFATYQVELEMPALKTVVTSGDKVDEKKAKKGYKKIISQAFSVSNFGAIFFDNIKIEKREADGIKIRVYHSPESAPWTEGLSDVAADIVRFYIKEVGFYPQKVINIIPGSKTFGGGFPIASNIFAIHKVGMSKEYGKAITAHEIAHSYWGFDYVLVPGEYGFWLGIALGIYTDSLYNPIKTPPYRWGYMLHQLMGYNTTLMQSNEEFKKLPIDLNNILAHSKGPTVIAMLEYVVGKETFRKIFHALLERFKYRILTAQDFQKVCEEISGQDLKWFFDPWLYSGKAIDYAISEVKTIKKENQFSTQVTVKKKGEISMPVEVEITTIDGKKYTKIFPRELSEGRVEFFTPSGLSEVRLDPSQVLPFLSRGEDDIDMSKIRYCYENGSYLLCLKYCEKLLYKQPQNGHVRYYRGRALRKLGHYELALKIFQEVNNLKDKYKSASDVSPWCHINRGYIYDLQGLRQLALDEYEKALALPDNQSSREEAQKRLKEPFSEE